MDFIFIVHLIKQIERTKEIDGKIVLLHHRIFFAYYLYFKYG